MQPSEHDGALGVYLLHFEPAYKHAQHYLGWSNNIGKRVREHLNPVGYRASPLVRAAILNGSEVTLVRVWLHAHQDTEKKLKNQHSPKRLCPVCSCTSA